MYKPQGVTNYKGEVVQYIKDTMEMNCDEAYRRRNQRVK